MHLTKHFYLPFLILMALVLSLSSGCDEVEAPELLSLEPELGPRETLVVMKGNNLGEIRELAFNGEPIPFNTAYNSDVALLFRIPANIALGEKIVTVRTDGGSFETRYTVTEDAPLVERFFPRSADVGDLITLIGEGFFEPPLEAYFKTGEFIDGQFTDSLLAEIVFAAEDSMIVRVPEGATTGRIRLVANGGTIETGLSFQIFQSLLVTDFDGGGFIANDAYTFVGSTDQQAGTSSLIRSTLPGGIDGNFMQISGMTTSPTNVWLGGPQTQGGPAIDSFGIITDEASTFLSMDVNSNGFTSTYLTLVLGQQDDFTEYSTTIQLTDPGWSRISIPFVRFRNFSGFVVDPQQVNQLKFQIEDRDGTGQRIEANIDNVRIVERI